MAAAVRIKFYGKRVEKLAAAELRKRLLLAGEIVRAEAVRSISIPTSTAGPSLPFQAPHADTGRLRASIMVATRGDEVLVGTRLKYGLYLEIGTSYMAARPWLRPAVYACWSKLQRLFKK